MLGKLSVKIVVNEAHLAITQNIFAMSLFV